MNSPATAVSGPSYVKALEHPDLWLAFKRHGDMRARHRLIELNIKLVEELMKNFVTTGETSMTNRDDMVAWGRVGLVEAIDRFDPDRGLRFSTFACPTILGKIREYLRRTYKPGAQNQIPLDDEILLDTPADTLSVFGSTLKTAQQDYLKQCIRWLPFRERAIIVMRFYYDIPIADISEHLGMEPSHVKQVRARAIKRIRGWMNAQQWTLYSNTPAPMPVPQLIGAHHTYIDSPLGRVRVCRSTPTPAKRRGRKAKSKSLFGSVPARTFRLVER